MKKLLTVLLLASLLCCALALVSCDEADTPNDDTNGDHVHAFGEWTVTTAATCTTEGMRTRTCECGESETEKISASHKWGAWEEASPATCNTAGSKTHTCKVCGTTESAAIAATGIHDCDTSNICKDCGTEWSYTATGINYGEAYDGTCYVSSVDTSIPADIVLPYYHNGKKLTQIREGVFNGRTNLKSIVLPPTITGIDRSAFSGCTNLEVINIPDSVIYIGNDSFSNCSSLTSITIPSSVAAIGYDAFNGCTKLIQTEGGVSYVDKWVVDCDGSITQVNLRNDTVGFGDGAFDYCSSLTSITIPSGVTSIGDGAFSDCSSLTSITIPSSVTSIGDSAFYRCSSLTSITIPSSVADISDSAFYCCSNLTSITIPSSVTSIGNLAFHYCSSLTSITIPSSVTSIGSSAFTGCTKLIQIEGGVSYVDKWVVGCDGSITQVNLRNDTVGIGDSAFYYCNSLTSITIPSSVASIGYNAFSGCTKLIQTEGGVSYVDKWVVGCNFSITQVNLRNDTVGIGDYAFSGCSSLTSITIPSSVTSIGSGAFEMSYPYPLTSVVFENTENWRCTHIGDATKVINLSATDLANPSTAATYLNSTYRYYIWKRG